jgi:hypothetical protein
VGVAQVRKTKDLYRVPGSFSYQAGKIYKAMQIQRGLDACIYEARSNQSKENIKIISKTKQN